MDLDEQIEIKEDELKEFAEWVKCDYVLTSAWENRGIEEAFKKLVRAIQKDVKPAPAGGGDKSGGGASPTNKGGDKLTAKKDGQEKKDGKKDKCC